MSIDKIEPSWNKWVLNNTFNANNTLISLLTTLFFITALVLFFWFVISDQLKIIVLDKLEILKLYSKYNSDFKKLLKEKISNKKLDEEKYNQIIKERNNNNIKTFKEMLSWWFIVLFIIVILNIIYIIRKNNFTKSDMLLVFFVLTAFIAEIIFYLVIIKEWIIVGDNEIIREIIKND
jgi:hypothetical protein